MIPKLSVIVPVYNTSQYLYRCLNSITNQTFMDIEIICINDGSTDNSLDILKDFKLKDRRIKIINQQNSGVATARNKGMHLATGTYIGFVDSDDYIDLEYYKELMSYTSVNYDLIRGIRVIGEQNKHGKNEYGCIIPSIIKRKFLHTNNLLFPENKKTGEDSTFKRWIYKKTTNIFECPDKGIYYHYMQRAGSLSGYDL